MGGVPAGQQRADSPVSLRKLLRLRSSPPQVVCNETHLVEGARECGHRLHLLLEVTVADPTASEVAPRSSSGLGKVP